MVQEIKRGDLVVITGLSTGDPQWSAELYRTRIPVLVSNGPRGRAGKKPWVTVFYQGKRRHIRSNQVEIFNEKKSKK